MEPGEQLFGERAGLARRYAEHLSTTGVTHGLIGPREVPRLWDRHVMNCAVIAPVFEQGASVADVGSGAGLPGLVLAIARPDLRVHLVEPLQRRTSWLDSVVEDLELVDQVTVHRGRAEQLWGQLGVDAVTSRAVAQLGELARLSLPLLRPGGSMVALKGERAAAELDEDREILKRLRVKQTELLTLGEGVVSPVSTVVVLHIDGQAPQIAEPVGPGPARTAAAKRARRRERRRGAGH